MLKLLLISNEPLSKASGNRINIDVLVENNDCTEYAFFLPLDTHTFRDENINCSTYQNKRLGYHRLKTWTSIIKFVIKNGGYDAIIWLFPITRWRSFLAFYIIRVFFLNSKVGLLYVKPLTFPNESILKSFKSKGHLKLNIFERVINYSLRRLSLFKVSLNFVIVSGSEAENFLRDKIRNYKSVKKIYTLSFNASKFMRQKKRTSGAPKSSSKKIKGVFIDQGLPLHPDFRKGQLDVSRYYDTLFTIINRTEEFYSAKVDISLHPRIDRTQRVFQNLNFLKAPVFDEIDNYDFALTMFSSGAEFFILSAKPVIVLSPTFCLTLFPEILGMASALNLEPITEFSEDISFPELKLDAKVREAYLSRYSFQYSQTKCIWLDTLGALESWE